MTKLLWMILCKVKYEKVTYVIEGRLFFSWNSLDCIIVYDLPLRDRAYVDWPDGYSQKAVDISLA